MKTLRTWAAAAAIAALTGAAQAALIDRGGGMIYDTTRNLTWLADMNYARTSGHTGTGVNADGRMTWDAANAWASNLVYGGFDDWRLPTMNPADSTSGELGGLFVTDLGAKFGQSVLDQLGDTAEQIANLALFSNVLPRVYWSGTEYSLGDSVWVFNGIASSQFGGFGKDGAAYAVAVRPGDVAASVPEPQTLALALLALGATAVARRRRPA